MNYYAPTFAQVYDCGTYGGWDYNSCTPGTESGGSILPKTGVQWALMIGLIGLLLLTLLIILFILKRRKNSDKEEVATNTTQTIAPDKPQVTSPSDRRKIDL